MEKIKKILAPLDIEDEGSDNVLDYAAEMAKSFDAELVVMHAVALSPYYGLTDETASEETIASALKSIRENAEEGMDYILKDDKLKGVNASGMVVSGDPTEEILRAVENTKADMIVMGTSGCSGMSCYIFGSVAHKVLQSSPVPITVVHP